MQYPIEIPELVESAKRLAVSLGFDHRPEGNAVAGEVSSVPMHLRPAFVDGSGVHAADDIAPLVKVGGLLLIDDLTPEACWPDAWRGKPDPKRELAFNSGLFRATEVQLRENMSALLLVRI